MRTDEMLSVIGLGMITLAMITFVMIIQMLPEVY
jgi:hypothetical protein